MRKIFWMLISVVIISCEYHDLSKTKKVCYLSTEVNSSGFIAYYYNQQNELVSYSSPDVYSSILTYANGKIVSELDNQVVSVNYTYDNLNRIILWSETIKNYPDGSFQTKFFYNAFGQDTLQQYFKYSSSTDNFYLWRFSRRDFQLTTTKNYSRKRLYDAATNNLLLTEEFFWDNNPNPYLENAFFLNETPPTNNITQRSITFPGQNPQVTNFGYAYNSNGFPLYKLSIPDSVVIGQYTYTSCQ